MPDLFVVRNAGNLRGEDVVDPLLTTVEACVVRGRMELDANASGLQDVEVELLVHDPSLTPGKVLGVVDGLSGVTWFGKITGVSHSVSRTHVVTTLSLRRPTVATS